MFRKHLTVMRDEEIHQQESTHNQLWINDYWTFLSGQETLSGIMAVTVTCSKFCSKDEWRLRHLLAKQSRFHHYSNGPSLDHESIPWTNGWTVRKKSHRSLILGLAVSVSWMSDILSNRKPLRNRRALTYRTGNVTEEFNRHCWRWAQSWITLLRDGSSMITGWQE